MLAIERQRFIEEWAKSHGEVPICTLAKELNVSVESIRRDINLLCERNILKKVHGGAVPLKKMLREDAYEIRRMANREIKQALGICAAKMIEDNDICFFSSGSTIEFVAEAVQDVHNVTFITNSLQTANILQKKNICGDFTGEIIVIGGRLNPSERFMYGPVSYEQMEELYVNKAFISASAISCEGLMSTVIEEGHIAGYFFAKSPQRIVIAEGEKLGRESIYRFAPLDGVNCLITDKNVFSVENPQNRKLKELKDRLAKSGAEIKLIEL